VGLLVVGADDGDEGVAERLELGLGAGVEEGQLGDVDSLVGVEGVDDDGGASGSGLAAGRNAANASEEVLGVLEVGLLLGAAQTLALLSLVLILGEFTTSGELGGAGQPALLDALGLGLLIGLCLSLGLSLCLLGLLGLLALYLGVLGGIPGVEDL
jgi:hypothetical protein